MQLKTPFNPSLEQGQWYFMLLATTVEQWISTLMYSLFLAEPRFQTILKPTKTFLDFTSAQRKKMHINHYYLSKRCFTTLCILMHVEHYDTHSIKYKWTLKSYTYYKSLHSYKQESILQI